jgi:hypothetical protein
VYPPPIIVVHAGFKPFSKSSHSWSADPAQFVVPPSPPLPASVPPLPPPPSPPPLAPPLLEPPELDVPLLEPPELEAPPLLELPDAPLLLELPAAPLLELPAAPLLLEPPELEPAPLLELSAKVGTGALAELQPHAKTAAHSAAEGTGARRMADTISRE